MAAGFFCRAITSAGHDIENLITALGERGLGELLCGFTLFLSTVERLVQVLPQLLKLLC